MTNPVTTETTIVTTDMRFYGHEDYAGDTAGVVCEKCRPKMDTRLNLFEFTHSKGDVLKCEVCGVVGVVGGVR